MDNKNILIFNIDKMHTTEMGIARIKKNLKINVTDVTEYCKDKILKENCIIYKKGKNWYCEIDNIKITINSYSYTIITAHCIKYVVILWNRNFIKLALFRRCSIFRCWLSVDNLWKRHCSRLLLLI